MNFDTTLNIAWLSGGLLALASVTRFTCRNRNGAGIKRRWLHVVGVALIVTALFPYISATDDALRIQHFSTQQDRHHSTGHGQNDNLMRLYEAMDSPLVSHAAQVVLTLLFIRSVSAPKTTVIERFAPSEAGRSPPVLLDA